MMLQKDSNAERVEIDTASGAFLFFFYDYDGSASCAGGPPWAILGRETKVDLTPDDGALLQTERLVRIGDEDAAPNAEQLDAIRKATGLVWRQFMLRAFDRAVSIKSIVLNARIQSVAAPFERLPADVWPVLEVLDWENGVAVAPDGSVYWSIHVRPFAEDATIRGRSAEAAAHESGAIKAVHLGTSSAARAGGGAKKRGITEAIEQLWPNGIPKGLSAKQRNIRIVDWLKNNGCSVPASPERAIQRAINTPYRG
jgi:hypothetical protein